MCSNVLIFPTVLSPWHSLVGLLTPQMNRWWQFCQHHRFWHKKRTQRVHSFPSVAKLLWYLSLAAVLNATLQRNDRLIKDRTWAVLLSERITGVSVVFCCAICEMHHLSVWKKKKKTCQTAREGKGSRDYMWPGTPTKWTPATPWSYTY